MHEFWEKALPTSPNNLKMENKRKIVQYRERLDKTLALPDLTNEEKLKTVVKNQLHSSEQEIEGYCIPYFHFKLFRLQGDKWNEFDYYIGSLNLSFHTWFVQGMMRK